MTRRSTLVSRALDARNEVRDEFERFRMGAFSRASDVLSGHLLNERGRREKIDAYSLFIGPELRAYAYASEELIAHWQTFPRPVFERYERQAADMHQPRYMLTNNGKPISEAEARALVAEFDRLRKGGEQ